MYNFKLKFETEPGKVRVKEEKTKINDEIKRK